jgi:hypothetical protein
MSTYTRPKAAHHIQPSATVSYSKMYRYRQSRGTPARQDSTAAREHVAHLVAMGLTPEAIARAARVNPGIVGALHKGRRPQMDYRTAAALLAVTHHPHPNQAVCLTVGAARRAYALAAMGWPLAWLSRNLGVRPHNLSRMLKQPRISYRYWVAIRDLYETHAHLPGPSASARDRARRLAWPPPLAWDDDLIDDPDAQPEGVGWRRTKHAEIQHGTEAGARAHQRAGEQPCAECRGAVNRAEVDRRARRTA